MAQTRYKDCLFVCPLVPIRHKEEETREMQLEKEEQFEESLILKEKM